MTRLFAHRGFAKTKNLQNTITSLNQAKENGFEAIEFDIWFLEGELFLKHNLPEKTELKELPNFRDYLTFQNELIYWLDFKNLDKFNVRAALTLVKNEINQAKIDLNKIYFAPFITDYFLAGEIFATIRDVFGKESQLVAVCEKLDDLQKINDLRHFLTKNKIKFLSIFHELLNQSFVEKFFDVEVFAWTVNDVSRLKDLQNLGVKNFATDKILPADLS